ncbi:3',5'-cyclic-nucleotide phosphodiesterase [[Actinomadura] parvosata subsp. kistnae]|uniref:Metallophosphoesterase n=1 Tax=[Actinomadura] parvosata subsp. kistnae TaxID=1909395 RepID=A0A1V0AHV1_9ACTN|nr:metallophosphoesterase [Nonomuraea sp. ATCC 55076]AQZ69804.1 metallophosphoesterase [Nonomuraea sp. ATCC 55076]SPL90093.1 3',5'-cyclic-nucleotide phosphodiesterase [Actinomadura parvosata subsp. kistnae]
MIVIAHVSDIHIGATPESVARATAVMRYLDALPGDLDAVLVTGDIADHGEREEYEEAAKVLAARHPVLVGPGNHDVRREFRRSLLGEEPADGPINQVLRTGRAVYAMCDSSIPGRSEGELTEETLTWLEGVLDGTDLPVFVAFHHPPVLLHGPVDQIGLRAPERLESLLAGRAQVPAVLTGHAHTAAAATFAGRPLLVGGGVVSTLKLPWEGGTSLDNCADYALPPLIAFHVFDDEGRVTTHFRAVPV